MNTLRFTTTINAPKERVWSAMLDDKTYREWTSAFSDGSYYEGGWKEGSKILFLSPGGNGMSARIAENRPYEFISIEVVGFVQNGAEDTASEGARAMAGAHENYTFSESDGVTTVEVDTDTSEEYRAMFEESWPKALKKLKELCEQG
ncbi:MAG: SRPBCC family protein [Longimicrobiaceae bacterium]